MRAVEPAKPAALRWLHGGMKTTSLACQWIQAQLSCLLGGDELTWTDLLKTKLDLKPKDVSI